MPCTVLAAEQCSGRVLVVEDDPLIRFMIAEALRDLWIVVIEASSAEEALGYLRCGTPQVDLVFTDHNLSGQMKGAQLARMIHQEFRNIPVFVTSGQGDVVVSRQTFVAKPYDPVAIAATLADMLRKHKGGGHDG